MANRLKINLVTGLLEPVSYRPSPHHDDRSPDASIDMVVVHCISLPPGEYGSNSIEEFFGGQLDTAKHPFFKEIEHLKVSSHVLIKRTGEIVQFVPFLKRAWHAGESSFQGKTLCNDFSIGIELEGTDTKAYEQIQYQQLAKLIDLCIEVYPAITHDRIVGHSDIAPSRKTDPGPLFDWTYLKGILT